MPVLTAQADVDVCQHQRKPEFISLTNDVVVAVVNGTGSNNNAQLLAGRSETKTIQIERFFCGGVAGAVSRTCTAPIDRLKVLRQTGNVDIFGKSMVQGFRVMLAEGGVRSLWRGNGVNVLKNCPESAIRFGLHGQLKALLFPGDKELHTGQRIAVASLAGATSLTCVYPIEVMKTRMALRRTGDPVSLLGCLRTLYSQGGLASLYRGYAVSLTSYVPYSGAEMAIYEMLKRRYLEWSGLRIDGTLEKRQNWLPPYVAIGLCMISVLTPMLVVYPANLLRTRFQAATADKTPAMLSSLVAIYRNEGGVPALYRGFMAAVSKTLPAVCISYLTFEAMTQLLAVPGLGAR